MESKNLWRIYGIYGVGIYGVSIALNIVGTNLWGQHRIDYRVERISKTAGRRETAFQRKSERQTRQLVLTTQGGRMAGSAPQRVRRQIMRKALPNATR